MSETASSNFNSPTIQPTPVDSLKMQKPVEAPVKNVPVGEATKTEQSVVETPVKQENIVEGISSQEALEEAGVTRKRFDTNTIESLSIDYIRKFMSGLGKDPAYYENEHGDGRNLGQVMDSPDGITQSFKGQVRRDVSMDKSNKSNIETIASSDTQNYRYQQMPNGNNGFDLVRIPIDANKKDIGLPEACTV